jgi:hypothetical protein
MNRRHLAALSIIHIGFAVVRLSLVCKLQPCSRRSRTSPVFSWPTCHSPASWVITFQPYPTFIGSWPTATLRRTFCHRPHSRLVRCRHAALARLGNALAHRTRHNYSKIHAQFFSAIASCIRASQPCYPNGAAGAIGCARSPSHVSHIRNRFGTVLRPRPSHYTEVIAGMLDTGGKEDKKGRPPLSLAQAVYILLCAPFSLLRLSILTLHNFRPYHFPARCFASSMLPLSLSLFLAA